MLPPHCHALSPLIGRLSGHKDYWWTRCGGINNGKVIFITPPKAFVWKSLEQRMSLEGKIFAFFFCQIGSLQHKYTSKLEKSKILWLEKKKNGNLNAQQIIPFANYCNQGHTMVDLCVPNNVWLWTWKEEKLQLSFQACSAIQIDKQIQIPRSKYIWPITAQNPLTPSSVIILFWSIQGGNILGTES